MKTLLEVEKQNRRAKELATVWDRWFPSLAGQAPVEFWMVMLEDFRINTLSEAIRRCARERVKTPMTLPDMQTFITAVAPQIEQGAPR